MATKGQKAALAELRALSVKPELVRAAAEPALETVPEPVTQPVAQPSPEPPVDPLAPSKGGRPRMDTEQISLRPSRELMRALRRRAAEESIAVNRTVTPQQVILQILEEAFSKDKKLHG